MARERSAAVDKWQDSQGTLVFSVPYPGIVRQTVTGRATVAMAEKIMEKLEAAIARHGTLTVFDDWEAATGYESEVRIRLTAWTERHKGEIPETHILVGSKLVSMGLAVAAIVLRKPIYVYSDRRVFERAFSAAASAKRERGTG